MNNLEKLLINDFSILIYKLCLDRKLFKFNNYKVIHFIPPDFQTETMHPETKHKFIKIFSLPLPKGLFGPFYRYTPYDNFLLADNDIGGYFTLKKVNCIGCAKRDFWLYDKNRTYFYNKNGINLYRYECCFDIEDDSYSTIFIGEISFGDGIQVRPNNWIFGGDTNRKNKVYYKKSKNNKLIKLENINNYHKLSDPNDINCQKCNKSFINIFEKI